MLEQGVKRVHCWQAFHTEAASQTSLRLPEVGLGLAVLYSEACRPALALALKQPLPQKKEKQFYKP